MAERGQGNGIRIAHRVKPHQFWLGIALVCSSQIAIIAEMGWVGELFGQLERTERFITAAVTISIVGGVCYWAERIGFVDFFALPGFLRLLASIVWIIAAVLVLVHVAIALWKGATWFAAHLGAIPKRMRRAAVERPLLERLRQTDGLQREVLCFALQRRDNHIWLDSMREPAWLADLKRKGILERTDAAWGTTHYAIHPAAWAYMNDHSGRFACLLRWVEAPWHAKFDEKKVEARLSITSKAGR